MIRESEPMYMVRTFSVFGAICSSIYTVSPELSIIVMVVFVGPLFYWTIRDLERSYEEEWKRRVNIRVNAIMKRLRERQYKQFGEKDAETVN